MRRVSKISAFSAIQNVRNPIAAGTAVRSISNTPDVGTTALVAAPLSAAPNNNYTTGKSEKKGNFYRRSAAMMKGIQEVTPSTVTWTKSAARKPRERTPEQLYVDGLRRMTPAKWKDLHSTKRQLHPFVKNGQEFYFNSATTVPDRATWERITSHGGGWSWLGSAHKPSLWWFAHKENPTVNYTSEFQSRQIDLPHAAAGAAAPSNQTNRAAASPVYQHFHARRSFWDQFYSIYLPPVLVAGSMWLYTHDLFEYWADWASVDGEINPALKERRAKLEEGYRKEVRRTAQQGRGNFLYGPHGHPELRDSVVAPA